MPKLLNIVAAWDRYWTNACRFWQPVFEAFTGVGDFDTWRTAYVAAGVHATVSSDIRALRRALVECQDECRMMPSDSGLPGIPALFDSVLLMLQGAQEGEGHTKACDVSGQALPWTG